MASKGAYNESMRTWLVPKVCRRIKCLCSLLLCLPGWYSDSALGQITANARDTVPPAGALRIFHTNGSDVPNAAQWIGQEGGPQTWDFRNAPGTFENRYFYAATDADNPEHALYPGAQIIELLSQDGAPANDKTFLRFQEGIGKETIGFSTQEGGAQSDSPFASPLLEFPEHFSLGERWDDGATFPLSLTVLTVVVEAEVKVEQAVEVDAWGTVILPGLGEVDALRGKHFLPLDNNRHRAWAKPRP